MGRTGVLTLRLLRLHREDAARRQRLQAGGTQPRIPKASDVRPIVTLQPPGLWDQCPPQGTRSSSRPHHAGRCLTQGPAAAAGPPAAVATPTRSAPASGRRPGPWASPPARAPQQGPPGLPGAVSALSLGSTHSAESSRGTGTWGAGQSRLTTGLPAEPLCPRPATRSRGSYQPSPATDSARSQALPPCIATPSRGQTPNPLSPSQSKQVGTARQGPTSSPWGWPALNAAGPGEEPSVCACVTQACHPEFPLCPGLPWAQGSHSCVWGGGAQRGRPSGTQATGRQELVGSSRSHRLGRARAGPP